MNHENFLWCEKYRPKNVEECILPKKLKKKIQDLIVSGEIPHFLFSGKCGIGKTSLARAIAAELGADLLYVNCSDENGIDTIRNKITQFASTVSFEDNLKIVLCDEADYLSHNAQAALRSVVENFSSATRFIFTCNFKNKIMEALYSRCTTVDFKIEKEDKQEVASQFLRTVIGILKIENIKFDPKVVASFVQKYFPDFRKTLMELQSYSSSGEIDTGILIDKNTSLDELVEHLKKKSFKEVRAWMARNSDFDHQQLFSYIYENLNSLVEPSSAPSVVILLAQYQFYSSNVVDQEINSVAMLTELMSEAIWK